MTTDERPPGHHEPAPPTAATGASSEPVGSGSGSGSDSGSGSGSGSDSGAGAPIRGLAPGERIGRYVIRERIGEGGFGLVYRAEQLEPVRREVAIKLVKPGMDSAAVLARFEAERQALALMDHPGVAGVLDGGATEDGRPYFVMELVRGIPVTEHCDRHRLDVRERLALFTQICEAVQHAHAKGVIHRDLKPANILVTFVDGRGVPKVIDFGVAKALSQRLTDRTLFTTAGALVGTPEYMSPEQAESGPQGIDTRSDVYALGVILYELLTGTQPFDGTTLRRAGALEVQRIIREVDPPRPSLRLVEEARGASAGPASSADDVAAARRTEVRTLRGTLRRDLDWIVMKALEKDRERRYDTPSALAAEVRRFLDDEPVLAGPPSARYRAGKFVRRHRAGVAAASVAAVALLVGLGGTGWGLLEAREQTEVARRALAEEAEQRRVARDEAARATAALAERDAALAAERDRTAELEAVAAFQEARLAAVDAAALGRDLRSGLRERIAAIAERSGLEPDAVDGRLADYDRVVEGADVTGLARSLLHAAVLAPSIEAIDDRFGDDPVLRGRLLRSTAETLVRLGLFPEAEDPSVRALSLLRASLGDDDPRTIEAMHARATVIFVRGDVETALPLYREAMERGERVLGPDDETTLAATAAVGDLLLRRGDVEASEAPTRRALAGRRRTLGESHPDTLESARNLAEVLRNLGRLDEAVDRYRDALAIAERVHGPDHLYALMMVNNIGTILVDTEGIPAAIPYFRRAMEGCRRSFGDGHPNTLATMHNLGSHLRAEEVGRYDEGARYLAAALEGKRSAFGERHPSTRNSRRELALALDLAGRPAEAIPLRRTELADALELDGPEARATAYATEDLARSLFESGAVEAALPVQHDALARAVAAFGPASRDAARAHAQLGRVLLARGDFGEAETHLLAAHAIRAETDGPGGEETLAVVERTIELYDAWADAEPGAGHAEAASRWRARRP